MIGMHVIMAYGFYKYFHGAREQRYVSSRLLYSPGPSRKNRNWNPDRYEVEPESRGKIYASD